MNEKIRRDVTNALVARIESGKCLPWCCPWDDSEVSRFMPWNYQTGNSYSGINVLLLWDRAAEQSFTRNAWLTLKQANFLGGKIRKNEKSQTCYFYKSVEIGEQKESDKEKRSIPLLKPFYLFNIDQIDHLEEINVFPAVPLENNAKALVDSAVNYCRNEDIKIIHQEGVASYNRILDVIGMPGSFDTQDALACTFAHETIHSTGSKQRLDRISRNGVNGDVDWNLEYDYEELVAELGAAFMCAEHNIVSQFDQSADYLNNWLSGFKGHSSFLFKAASDAAKAHRFIIDRSVSAETEDADSVITTIDVA